MPGYTKAEQYLSSLAQRSFLPLWSYTNIYRDEFDSKSGNSVGKEVCDLIIVFADHVLLFSDKDCEFKPTDDIRVGWRRWYKKAIASSAKQLYGAERWIREFPERLFLDEECTKPFPIQLPPKQDIKFHRIAVVHSISQHCSNFFNGDRGSLLFHSHIADGMHTSNDCIPFQIGRVDSSKDHIHVLDDVTLDILLKELDTVKDFTDYLEKKENLLNRSEIMAHGEEELLANYLSNINSNMEHDFNFPTQATLISLDGSSWDSYNSNPRVFAKREEDKISYVWDRFISFFSHHVTNDTLHYSNQPGVRGAEPGLRVMARTSRLERRLLGAKLAEFIQDNLGCMRAARYIFSTKEDSTIYLFLALGRPPGVSYEDYRRGRAKFLHIYLQGLKVKFPHLLDIVGIALDSDSKNGSSEDLAYLDARDWSNLHNKAIQQQLDDLGILQGDVAKKAVHIHQEEYPTVQVHSNSKGANRNKPCPCGSGNKYKKCCGR
ncbi:SEC-C metal-binding domain-containing protein [Deinococcus kurensis]|uniref:SEC-C metal-binding domain-containing protein n=1 Tax=Deinococcus kurensis TaxID=2662757 RepID=UPI0012D2F831|nr:SEC-C metal-binding domain-containing protein [Deinococcus kurensis]